MADPTNGSPICQYGSQELSGYSGPDPINISGAAAVLAAFGASPPAWLVPLLADLGSPTQSVADFCATSPVPPGDFDPGWLIPAPFGPVDGYANAVQWVYNRLWLALWSETCECKLPPPPVGDTCVVSGTFVATHTGPGTVWTWTEPPGVGVAHFKFYATCNAPGGCGAGITVHVAGTSYPTGTGPCPFAAGTETDLDVPGGGPGTAWYLESNTGSCTTNSVSVNWIMCFTPSYATYGPPTPPPAIQPPVPPSLPTPIAPVAPTATATITPAQWCSVLWLARLLPFTYGVSHNGVAGEGAFVLAGGNGLVIQVATSAPHADIGWNTSPFRYYRMLQLYIEYNDGTVDVYEPSVRVEESYAFIPLPDNIRNIHYKVLPGYVLNISEVHRTCPS